MTASMAILLACHEMRCAWEMAPFYQTNSPTTGKVVWRRKQQCLRGCGSTKTINVSPHTMVPRGRPVYNRPPEWKELGNVYFTAAMMEQIKAQLVENDGDLPTWDETEEVSLK